MISLNRRPPGALVSMLMDIFLALIAGLFIGCVLALYGIGLS